MSAPIGIFDTVKKYLNRNQAIKTSPLLFAVAVFFLAFSARRTEEEISMDIKIKLNKTTFFLGESVSVDITYENNCSEVIAIDNP